MQRVRLGWPKGESCGDFPPPFSPRQMNDIRKIDSSQSKIYAIWCRIGELLGVDNSANLEKKVISMVRDLSSQKQHLEEIVSLVGLEGLQQLGNAKAKIKKLMLEEFESFSSVPATFMVVPRHWREGIPASKKNKGVPPMLPSAAEKKLRREVWPYLRDLMSQLHLVTEIERVRILEDLEFAFQTEPPINFINRLYDWVHNLDEIEPDSAESSVPLSEALFYCVGLYPDLLLQDCREKAEEAGEVARSWFESTDAKFAAANTAEEREAIARLILTRFIYRLSGGEGVPTPAEENRISPMLSTERWQPYGPEFIVTAETRLADLLQPLAIFDR